MEVQTAYIIFFSLVRLLIKLLVEEQVVQKCFSQLNSSPAHEWTRFALGIAIFQRTNWRQFVSNLYQMKQTIQPSPFNKSTHTERAEQLSSWIIGKYSKDSISKNLSLTTKQGQQELGLGLEQVKIQHVHDLISLVWEAGSMVIVMIRNVTWDHLKSHVYLVCPQFYFAILLSAQ